MTERCATTTSIQTRYPRKIWNGKGCYEKIKNPLIRRIPKELIGDWKKYLVVFLFLVLTIGFVSGMYVANESMITSANEGVTKYKQEDGHFELKTGRCHLAFGN